MSRYKHCSKGSQVPICLKPKGFLFKIKEIKACLYAEGNGPIKREKMMLQDEA